MIKAIVFDLDGMIHFTEGLWSKWFSNKYGVPYGLFDDFFENEFQKCVVGEADAKDELKKHLAKWDPEFSIELVFDSWFNYGWTDKDILLYVAELRKKGIRCFLCTNNERYRMQHFRKKHGIDSIFDDVIASSDCGCKKPEEGMFKVIEQKAGTDRKSILFCDDDMENCSAARKYGFTVHRFTDPKDFKALVTKLTKL